MKVQFDSNTWRLVVAPEDYKTDPDYVHCQKIHETIVRGKIEAY